MMKSSEVASVTARVLKLIEDDPELREVEPQWMLTVMKSAALLYEQRVMVHHSFECMKATLGLVLKAGSQ